jgi:ankyrin repeat protein
MIKPEKAVIRQFHEASLRGNTEKVQELLESTAGAADDSASAWQRFPLINRRGPEGRTALHVAAAADQQEVISILLENAANVEIVDRRGWSALHEAAHASSEGACRMLVEAGADVHLRDILGMTPHQVASRNHADASVLEVLDSLGDASGGAVFRQRS